MIHRNLSHRPPLAYRLVNSLSGTQLWVIRDADTVGTKVHYPTKHDLQRTIEVTITRQLVNARPSAISHSLTITRSTSDHHRTMVQPSPGHDLAPTSRPAHPPGGLRAGHRLEAPPDPPRQLRGRGASLPQVQVDPGTIFCILTKTDPGITFIILIKAHPGTEFSILLKTNTSTTFDILTKTDPAQN